MLAPSCFLIGFVIHKVIQPAGSIVTTTGWQQRRQQSGYNNHCTTIHNTTAADATDFCDILIETATNDQHGFKSSLQLH